MLLTRRTEDPLLGMWILLGDLGPGRSPADLGNNKSGIGLGKRHADGVGGFTGSLATTLIRLTMTTSS